MRSFFYNSMTVYPRVGYYLSIDNDKARRPE